MYIPFHALIMHYYAYFDKRGVLKQEYSQPTILPGKAISNSMYLKFTKAAGVHQYNANFKNKLLVSRGMSNNVT